MNHMERKIINILDYGAKADGKDCTVPVQNALEAIKNSNEAATLLFPRGEYHFYKENAQRRIYHTSNTNSLDYPVKHIGILLEEQEDLCIDGDGSLFLFHGNMMALAVVKSKQIELSNFSWDFPCATVSEMEVVQVTKNQVIYTVPPAQTYEIHQNDVYWFEKSPLTGETYWNFKNQEYVDAIVVYKPWDKTAIRCQEEIWPFSNVKEIQELKGHRLKITYKDKVSKELQPGMCFEICRNAYRETAGAFLWESERVGVKNVGVHFLNSFGWLVQMCHNVAFKNCRFMPREDTGRRAAGFADLIHVSGASGEIRIEESEFSNAHDDSINIHGTFTRVREMLDPHTLILEYVHNQQGGFPGFYSGDNVIFYARDTLQGVNGEARYTVDSAGAVMSEDGKSMRVTFAEELPACLSEKIGMEGLYVAENETYTPSVLIRKCRFETIPTRGILCTTRKKVVLEENEFTGMGMASVFISNDSNDWYESGPVRDMEIRNNNFYLLNPYGYTAGNTAICIEPIVKGGKLPGEDYPVHKNIRIHDNVFYIHKDKVLVGENVENLQFYYNKIICIGEIIDDQSEVISLSRCKNAKIYDNEMKEYGR